MPTFSVVMSVEECEGVAVIRPAEGRQWGVKLRCSSCNEETPNYVYFNEAETFEADGGGGVRNLVMRCGFCKAVLSVNVEANSVDGFHADGESGKLIDLEVRGGEPTELEMDDQWVVESAGGAKFEGADLSQDWCEYDEKAGESLNISGVEVSFEKMRKKK